MLTSTVMDRFLFNDCRPHVPLRRDMGAAAETLLDDDDAEGIGTFRRCMLYNLIDSGGE